MKPGATPYIDKPDTLPIDNGMLCWRHERRVCGGDCVAYNAEAGEGAGPNACVILVYQGQVAAAKMQLVQLRARERGPAALPNPPSVSPKGRTL